MSNKLPRSQAAKFDPYFWGEDKDITAFSGQRKVQAGKYDRYLDLHFCSDTGWDDFAAQIDLQGAYQERAFETGGDGVGVCSFLSPQWPNEACELGVDPVAETDLPNQGVVHYAVRRNEIQNVCNTGLNQEDEKHRSFARLVKWVCGGQSGKIRLNAHGLPGGVIHMTAGFGSKEKHKLDASGFAKFLVLCGLTKGDRGLGLKTICLCICHGASPARSRTATKKGIQSISQSSSPMGDSLTAMKKVALVLTENHLKGIDVTGSDRETNILDSKQGVNWDHVGTKSAHELVADIGSTVRLSNRDKIEIRNKLQPPYRALFDYIVTGTSPGKIDLGLVRSLYADVQRVLGQTGLELKGHDDKRLPGPKEDANVHFPKGATAGQWGAVVLNPETGVRSWVRVRDLTRSTFRITSG